MTASKKHVYLLVAFMTAGNSVYCGPLPAPPHVPLGMNSNGTSYYTPDFIFKNMMAKMGEWNAYDTGQQNREIPTTYDSQGTPQTTVSYGAFYTWIGAKIQGGYLGDYVLLWDGDGEVVADNNGTAFPSSKAEDHRFTFTLTSWPTPFTVRIKSTSPTNPVRNLRLLQAKYEGDYLLEPYQPDFINTIAKFDTFRFMDLGNAGSWATKYGGVARAVGSATVQLDDQASREDNYYQGWFWRLKAPVTAAASVGRAG
jgi:hypothetical protein